MPLVTNTEITTIQITLIQLFSIPLNVSVVFIFLTSLYFFRIIIFFMFCANFILLFRIDITINFYDDYNFVVIPPPLFFCPVFAHSQSIACHVLSHCFPFPVEICNQINMFDIESKKKICKKTEWMNVCRILLLFRSWMTRKFI